MIQVIQEPDARVTEEVRRFLVSPAVGGNAVGEHDPRWLNVLREGLGHQPYMLIGRRGGDSAAIAGYLPLMLVKSRLFGRFLVSLPYVDRAGVIAADATIAAELIGRAVRLAEHLDVRYLELRQNGRVEHPQLGASRDEKVRLVLSLPAAPATIWSSLGRKQRNQVRKGSSYDLTIHWGSEELLDEFYTVFATRMRDLGTPVFPKRLFGAILDAFRGLSELALVKYRNRPVAASLLLHHTGPAGQVNTTQVLSAGSVMRYKHTNANTWMFYQLILRAIERGSRELDFGRSSVDSGPYRFKKRWGAQPQPTVWQYHIRRGDMNDVRPDSPLYRRRLAVWQRLPVWLTRMIGPTIVKGIP